MDKQNFDTTVNSLFGGMDHVLSSKTVVGEPQVIGDTIILPLVDISFGMGAGAFNKEKGNSAGGGIGGKMSPSAILVIHNGQTKLVNIRDQDAITKVLDMVPDAVNKVVSIIKGDTYRPDQPSCKIRSCNNPFRGKKSHRAGRRFR